MEQEKYLSEEKYQETNKKVKKTSKILLIIGAILLVIGIIMIIVAFVNLKNSERNVMDSFNNSASNLFDSFNNSINNDDDGEEFVNSMKESVTAGTDSSMDSFTSVGLYALGGFVSSAGFVLLIVGGVMAYMAHRIVFCIPQWYIFYSFSLEYYLILIELVSEYMALYCHILLLYLSYH